MTFVVGDGDSRRFCIHRRLVSSSSVIFEDLVNSVSFEDLVKDFRPNYSPEIRLRDVCPSVFAIFAHWLYKGQFPDVEEDASTPSLLSLYLQAFVFGDAYSVLPFKQWSSDKIKKQLSNPGLPAKKFVRELFSYGEVTKPLQEVLVEAVTLQIHDRTIPQESDAVEWLKNTRHEIPKFSMDVAESLTRRILGSPSAVNAQDNGSNSGLLTLCSEDTVSEQTVSTSTVDVPMAKRGTKRTAVSQSINRVSCLLKLTPLLLRMIWNPAARVELRLRRRNASTKATVNRRRNDG